MPKRESKKSRVIKLYCCGVDWAHEILEAPDLEGCMPFYSSKKKLKAKRTCWQACGIIEVKVKFSQWVEPQDLLREFKK